MRHSPPGPRAVLLSFIHPEYHCCRDYSPFMCRSDPVCPWCPCLSISTCKTLLFNPPEHTQPEIRHTDSCTYPTVVSLGSTMGQRKTSRFVSGDTWCNVSWNTSVSSHHVNGYHYIKLKGKTQPMRDFQADEY